MGIAISGIASGIDSDSIISQLLALETTRIVQIQRKIAVEEQRREAFGSLTGQLEALRSAARKLQDPNLYGQLRASSSDSAVLTVNASAGAREGSYSVQVRQLATRHRVAAQGFVDRAGTAIAAGEGVFAFRVGNGAEVELDVDETTSLQDLADAINDADAGVRADIVNDGSAQNPYRLVLTAEEFGQDGRVTVTANDTTLDFDGTHVEAAVADAANAGDYDGAVLSGGTYTGSDNTTFIVEVIEDGAVGGDARFRLSTDGGLTFDDNGGAGYAVTAGAIDLADGVTIEFEDDGTLRAGDRFTIDVFNPELESPQDAIIAVNGISVRKSSNTIDDVFDGVSFNLQSAAPGRTININVRRETGDVQTALTGLLGAYNGVVGYLNAQFSYDPESGQAEPPLNGDPTARQVLRRVQSYFTGRIPGLAGDTLSALSELGFESNEKTGLLSFNSAKLDAALREDPDAVARILSRYGERLDGDFEFVRRSADTKPGTYRVEVTQARTRAEVSAGQAAEVLAADEQLTIGLSTRAQADPAVYAELVVDLSAGDTAAEQVAKINQAAADEGIALTAFLDADGQIVVRSNAYGADLGVRVQSDTAAGAGTSGFGDALVSDTGTDLAGTIGGRPARVIDGDILKGVDGYDTADIEVRIPGDTAGILGQVRISDGVSESLPDLIDGFTGGGGLLRSRSDGIGTRIERFEEDIIRQEQRTVQIEERLRRQFANLEVTLGRMQALGDYVSQQLASLPTVQKKK